MKQLLNRQFPPKMQLFHQGFGRPAYLLELISNPHIYSVNFAIFELELLKYTSLQVQVCERTYGIGDFIKTNLNQEFHCQVKLGTICLAGHHFLLSFCFRKKYKQEDNQCLLSARHNRICREDVALAKTQKPKKGDKYHDFDN